MDIIDVILGSALTPQGEIESFAARAEKAVADANTALNNIESITDQTNANNAAAQEALSTVNTALAALENDTIDLVNDEVKTAVEKVNAILISEKCRVDRIVELNVDNIEEEIHEALVK